MMDIIKARKIVDFLENLSPTEMNFVRTITHETEVKNCASRQKQKEQSKKEKKTSKRKYKRKNKRYDDEQIRQAHKLKEKGLNNRKISKKTGIRETSLSNTKWLKERIQAMVKIAPETVDKDMFI